MPAPDSNTPFEIVIEAILKFGSELLDGTIKDADIKQLKDHLASKGDRSTHALDKDNYTSEEALQNFADTIGPFLSREQLNRFIQRLALLEGHEHPNAASLLKPFLVYQAESYGCYQSFSAAFAAMYAVAFPPRAAGRSSAAIPPKSGNKSLEQQLHSMDWSIEHETTRGFIESIKLPSATLSHCPKFLRATSLYGTIILPLIHKHLKSDVDVFQAKQIFSLSVIEKSIKETCETQYNDYIKTASSPVIKENDEDDEYLMLLDPAYVSASKAKSAQENKKLSYADQDKAAGYDLVATKKEMHRIMRLKMTTLYPNHVSVITRISKPHSASKSLERVIHDPQTQKIAVATYLSLLTDLAQVLGSYNFIRTVTPKTKADPSLERFSQYLRTMIITLGSSKDHSAYETMSVNYLCANIGDMINMLPSESVEDSLEKKTSENFKRILEKASADLKSPEKLPKNDVSSLTQELTQRLSEIATTFAAQSKQPIKPAPKKPAHETEDINSNWFAMDPDEAEPPQPSLSSTGSMFSSSSSSSRPAVGPQNTTDTYLALLTKVLAHVNVFDTKTRPAFVSASAVDPSPQPLADLKSYILEKQIEANDSKKLRLMTPLDMSNVIEDIKKKLPNAPKEAKKDDKNTPLLKAIAAIDAEANSALDKIMGNKNSNKAGPRV